MTKSFIAAVSCFAFSIVSATPEAFAQDREEPDEITMGITVSSSYLTIGTNLGGLGSLVHSPVTSISLPIFVTESWRLEPSVGFGYSNQERRQALPPTAGEGVSEDHFEQWTGGAGLGLVYVLRATDVVWTSVGAEGGAFHQTRKSRHVVPNSGTDENAVEDEGTSTSLYLRPLVGGEVLLVGHLLAGVKAGLELAGSFSEDRFGEGEGVVLGSYGRFELGYYW